MHFSDLHSCTHLHVPPVATSSPRFSHPEWPQITRLPSQTTLTPSPIILLQKNPRIKNIFNKISRGIFQISRTWVSNAVIYTSGVYSPWRSRPHRLRPQEPSRPRCDRCLRRGAAASNHRCPLRSRPHRIRPREPSRPRCDHSLRRSAAASDHRCPLRSRPHRIRPQESSQSQHDHSMQPSAAVSDHHCLLGLCLPLIVQLA